MTNKLNNIVLNCYDEKDDNHNRLLLEFLGNSSSNYIHDIDRRLKNNKIKNDCIFDRGYIVSFNDILIGYVFISKLIKDDLYLEYSILKDYRGKGFGKLLLNEVSIYLIDNYNIKSIVLDIDPSNTPSIMTAVSCGYIADEEEYIERNMNGKILYRIDNYNYVNKRKK